MEKILFTKDNCQKCEYIKGSHNMGSMGFKIINMSDKENGVENLATAAWHEVVQLMETQMPILIDGNKVVPGAGKVHRYLKDNYKYLT